MMNRSRYALAALFLGAFAIQVANRDFFARHVPQYLGDHEEVVLPVTRGVLLATGISFLFPRLRLLARWGAIGILTASVPDAFLEVKDPQGMRKLGVPPTVALARIGAQGALIALVWGATHPRDSESA